MTTTTPSCIIPANPSPELRAALDWAEGFNRWDPDYLLSTVSDDYTHHVLPERLRVKPRNKEEFREYFTSIVPMFRAFKVTIHEIVEGPGKIVFHASSKGTSSTGATYSNEYSIFFHIAAQPTGPPKVSMVKEFVDSGFSVAFFAAEEKRQAGLTSNL